MTFLRKRSLELTGLMLALSGGFIAVSLFTYNAADPSLNHARDTSVIYNLGGRVGAWFAYPLLELIGLAALMLIITPLAWGIHCIRKKGIQRIWLRLSFIVLSVPTLCAAFTLLDAVTDVPVTWPSDSFGGFIGIFLNSKLAPFIGFYPFAAISLMLSFALVLYTWQISFSEWRYLGNKLWQILRGAGITLNYTAQGTRYLWGKYKGQAVAKPKRISKPKVEKTKRVVEPIRKRPSISKKTEQTSLTLVTPDDFTLPSLDLLKTPPKGKKETLSESALTQNAELLESVLLDFGVQGKITHVHPGPVVTLYELEPNPGTKSSRVIGLADDIARSMSAVSARIAVIPGRNAIGIELPNATRETVYLRELLETEEYQDSKHSLAIALGKTISGDPMIVDLAKMPHLLIAGTTGSGKSVGVNAMILSLLYKYKPNECKFIMVDPKMLELSVYDDIPHLLAPVVTDPRKAIVALKWTVKEMENRYRLMANLGVRNMHGYNKSIVEAAKAGKTLTRSVQTGFDPDTGKPIIETVPLDMNPLPYIVVIVDEMADLMLVAGKEIESSIQRLAQMARAAGIHIIMATQRPSVDVITGVIKANLPTRISFQVTSRIDSRTILGEQGAEQLLGMGDMLYMAGGSRITRVHGPFVDDKEVDKAVMFLKSQGKPQYVEDVTVSEEEEGAEGATPGEKDPLFDQAVDIVSREGKASTSFIQRHLRIGYNRAAGIIDQMEKEGIVSPANHVGKREVLVRTDA